MSNETTKELLLSKLADSNIPALTQIFGKALVEACGVCFENQKHSKGLTLQTHFKTNGTTTQVFKDIRMGSKTLTTRRGEMIRGRSGTRGLRNSNSPCT